MEKLGIFIVIIIAVIFGYLTFANRNTANKQETVSIATTPTPLSNQASPSAQITQEPIDIPKVEKAIISTSKGDIELRLFSKEAPQTVLNFVNKTREEFYNNLTFHRVEDWVIQGGDPKGDGTGGGKIASELNNKPFIVGSIGLARTPASKVVSNDSQFFITKKESSFLNGDYVNFGIVTKGMDVVEKIEIGDKILKINLE